MSRLGRPDRRAAQRRIWRKDVKLMTRRARFLLAAPAAFLVAALGTTGALAATTWTVTPGGGFTGTGTLTLSLSGGGLSCNSSIAGKLRGGKGPGSHIGSIASLGLTSCTGPLGLTWTVQAGGLPWAMNAQSYNSGTGTTTGKVTGMHLSVSGEACSFAVDGTGGSKDNGKVTFTYTNATHVLKLGKPGNLHAYNVSGCTGLVTSGSTVSLSASYTLTPPQTITSP
jgi:hypothetical protein